MITRPLTYKKIKVGATLSFSKTSADLAHITTPSLCEETGGKNGDIIIDITVDINISATARLEVFVFGVNLLKEKGSIRLTKTVTLKDCPCVC